jgi:hypothetical protein
VAARAHAAHHALTTALGELQSMIDGRLLLDRSSVVTPVNEALEGDRQPA